MPRKTAEQYLKEPYGKLIIPDGANTFSAEMPDFPGCFAQGATVEEAYRNLEEAAKSWIDVALARGHEIPSPSSSRNYSGHFHLRMPRSLHRSAGMRATRDGVSLNQCIVTAIAAWVGADNLYHRMAERLSSWEKVIGPAATAAAAAAAGAPKSQRSYGETDPMTGVFGRQATYGSLIGRMP